VVLDTPISSRLLAPGWSEALLLVDEPTQATQVVCTNSSGTCNLQGNGTGLGTYDGNIGRANVYQGQPVAANGSGITISANSGNTLTSGGTVRLMNTDPTGAGSFSPAGTCCGAVALTPDASGSIRAVFEVLGADPASVESVDLPFFLNYAAGAPALTSLSINAGLAPQNSAGADLISPLPLQRHHSAHDYGIGCIGADPSFPHTVPVQRFTRTRAVCVPTGSPLLCWETGPVPIPCPGCPAESHPR
jgi:hypothetical protein